MASIGFEQAHLHPTCWAVHLQQNSLFYPSFDKLLINIHCDLTKSNINHAVCWTHTIWLRKVKQANQNYVYGAELSNLHWCGWESFTFVYKQVCEISSATQLKDHECSIEMACVQNWQSGGKLRILWSVSRCLVILRQPANYWHFLCTVIDVAITLLILNKAFLFAAIFY